MTYDDIYETSAFAWLAQGMKDREAIDIVFALRTSGVNGAFEAFERRCEEELCEQAAA